MDVEQSVFDEGNGKKKTDQDRVEAGEKKDGPAQFEKIIGEIDDRPDNGHGDNAEDEVFDLKFLPGNPGRAKRLDQIFDAPIDTDSRKEGDQTDEDQKYQRFVKQKAIIKNIS